MTQEDIHKLIDARINVALDARLSILETTLNNQEEYRHESVENLIQQISAVGSDVKDLKQEFEKYTSKVIFLEKDKDTRDGWITWFIRTVAGIIIVAVAFVLGIRIK
jgi:hypothetical protein